ncbi:MAG: PKD domain-containing protein [Chitinophagaceae bacterium]|nr:PKD domain-containing protein [Chitinophagaceae bacterium]
MRKLLLFIGLLGLSFFGKAQDFSNRGTDFWLCYPGHIDGTSSRMALYISSTVNASGTITLPSGLIPFTVTANQATVVRIAANAYPVINFQQEGIATGKGIHIVSDQPVVVYAHILNAARSGSSLILPTGTLGREYLAASYPSSTNSTSNATNSNNAGSQFCIVAVENNTVVEITPTATDVNGTRPAGVPYTVTLNQGDVYQFRTVYTADVTGTNVRSVATAATPCKPIAVFSGSAWTSMNCFNASGGDNLFQQLMPKSALGKKYITAPFADREYDIFRIIVDDPTTEVNLNGSFLPLSSLRNGSYYEFTSSTPNSITTDKPVMVVQYMISQTCDSRNSGGTIRYPGDPEMVILNPIEQTINDVTVVSARSDLSPPATNITKHFFTIIMKTISTGSLKIDGAAPTGTFIPIPNTQYSYLHENVTGSTSINPSHRINADSGFICLAYGMGNVESYGYNAGTNVKDLYQFINISNDYATVNFPAGCKNSPFKFSMVLPYQPTTLQWKFGTQLNSFGIRDTLITSPTYDSTWVVDDKILYRYKINQSYTIPLAGTYPIQIIANNPTPDGCAGLQQIAYNLQIFNPPVASFTFQHNGCATDSVSFFDATDGQGRAIIKYSWDFGDNTLSNLKNPKHKYSSAGTKTVRFSTITDVGCLSDTTITAIPIVDPPIAAFSLDNIKCEQSSITFTNASSFPGGTISQWNWNFGDNSSLMAANGDPVQHTYAAAGTYTASLEVQSNTGCKSYVTPVTFKVNSKPLASFDIPAVVCLPAGAQFTDKSTIADGTQANFAYAWDFGDNSSATSKNPYHVFNGTGPYQIKLTVTSNNGCIDDSSRTLSAIYAQAKAKFDVSTEVCLGDTTRFTDLSDGLGNSISNWYWSFGDGGVGSTQNPVHIYQTPGTFTDTLYIKTDKGCFSDTVWKQTVVNPLPTAAFLAIAPICEKNDVLFQDKSIASVGTLGSWTWNFGDNSNATVNQPVHKYDTSGTYNVTLQVINSKGCKSTVLSQQVQVNPLPKPAFGTPEVCLSDPFALFTDSSSITDNSQNQFKYLWNFNDPLANAGNPNTSTLKNPQHRYVQSGIYNISLKVTSKDGCIDSLTKSFTVNGAIPQSGFNLNTTDLCSNKEISIKDASGVDFGSIVKVEVYWDYANNPTIKTVDEVPSPGKIYAHTYPEFGTPLTKNVQIRYVVYSGINCINESFKTITLKASPKIQFDVIPLVCEEIAPYNFTYARDIYGLAGVSTYSGDGINAAGLFSPVAAKPGSHMIYYLFEASNGCKAIDSQTVVVSPTPTADAGPDRTVLEGGFITIQGKGTGSGLSYAWTPATYLDNTTIATPKCTPTEDITYTFTVRTSDGCVKSDNVFIKVLRAPKIPNAFSPNGDGINDTWVIEHLESYPGATVEVFNRYGQRVYYSIGYGKAWDGNYNGSPLPIGTYYYIINPKNGRSQLNGSITIIR